MEKKEKIINELKKVIDPELGINIVDLGLIYDIEINDRDVQVVMTLTTPGCPLHDSITNGAKHVLEELEEFEHVTVKLVWEPAWTPDRMSKQAKAWLSNM